MKGRAVHVGEVNEGRSRVVNKVDEGGAAEVNKGRVPDSEAITGRLRLGLVVLGNESTGNTCTQSKPSQI
jgi:hypothetical protein